MMVAQYWVCRDGASAKCRPGQESSRRRWQGACCPPQMLVVWGFGLAPCGGRFSGYVQVLAPPGVC